MKIYLSIKANGPGGQIMSCAMVRDDGQSFLWIEQILKDDIHPAAKQAFRVLGHRPMEIRPLYSNDTKLGQVISRYTVRGAHVLTDIDSLHLFPRAHNGTPIPTMLYAIAAKPPVYEKLWTPGNAWCDAAAMMKGDSLVDS